MRALEQVADWPVQRAAVGVTRADEPVGATGPTDEVLPWASVTKPVTAYTALMCVDEGIVALDEPAGPEGATVEHLLAHASGLPFDGRSPVAGVGERRIYSNTGFEVLGELLKERTGIAIDVLVEENVLAPLGMDATRLAGSPAAGMEGSLDDLLAFGRELLEPTLVSPELQVRATSVAFPGLSGVLPGFDRQDPNDWGLGFEIRDGKQPHWTGSGNSSATYGHFGLTGSFLWVDPEAGVACACLADRDFGPWAKQAWPALADAVLEELGSDLR